jgi:RND family efflux transporter MFP subunit
MGIDSLDWMARRAGLGLILATMPLVGSGCERPLSAQAPRPAASVVPEPSPGQSRAVLVAAVQPTRAPLKRSTTQPAHVEPYEKADIYAKASGYLRTIHVDIGDRVKKGQVLAELSIPEMDTQLTQKQAMIRQAEAGKSQAEAAVRVALAGVRAAEAKLVEVRATIQRFEAELALAQSEFQRTQDLVNRAAATRSLLDEMGSRVHAAEANLAMVRAQVKSAEAALSQSRAELDKARSHVETAGALVEVARADLENLKTLRDYATVKVPFDGIVTRRLADTGAFIQSAETRKNDPIVTLVRIDRKRIVVDIPESEAGWVKIGQPAVFRFNSVGSRSLPGKVARITDALDFGSRTMRTEIELDQPEEIRLGIFGQATITLADYPDALLLPSTALLTGSEKPAVMVVENGRARRREVQVGLEDGVQAQILSGLDGNEQVIVEGKDAVRDGQAVEIAD